MENIAVIIYGDGGELGSFQIFARSLKSELKSKYKRTESIHINRDHKFFEFLGAFNPGKEKIAELHIFSHAIGAGLFLGYKDPVVARRREAVVERAKRDKKRVNYDMAVRTETGAIQTDDFLLPRITKQKASLQKIFTDDAFIKLWGCNSGIVDWVYSDNGGIADPHDKSVVYYWRAFNERNTPKPAIAQAIADFFDCSVYGASSGTSIVVKHKRKWISTQAFKNKAGKWPSGMLPHRLVPDRGDFREYKPVRKAKSSAL
ncbi:MAG: hypothetical protein AAFX52_14900 [Pseudomonadota bacterium]